MWTDCRAPAQLNFFFEGDFDKSPPVLGRLLSANEGDESFLLEESDDRWACVNCLKTETIENCEIFQVHFFADHLQIRIERANEITIKKVPSNFKRLRQNN